MYTLVTFAILLSEFYPYQFDIANDKGFIEHSYVKKNPSSLFLRGISTGVLNSFTFYSFVESQYMYDTYNHRVGLRGISRSRNQYFDIQNAYIGYGFNGISVYFNYDNMYRNLYYKKEQYVDEFGNVDSIVERKYDTLYYRYAFVISYLYQKFGTGFELGYIDKTKDLYGIAGFSYNDSKFRTGISYFYPFNYLFFHLSYRTAAYLPVIGSFSIFYKGNQFIPSVGISHYFDRVDLILSYGVFIISKDIAGIVGVEKKIGDFVSLDFGYRIYTNRWEEGDYVYEEHINALNLGLNLKW